MIKNKQQLASAITDFFNNKDVCNQIASFFESNNIENRRMSHIFGGILIYMVATREKNILPKTLSKLIEQNYNKNYFNSGELVAERLLMQLKAKNKNATKNDVLALFKQNFIDNGFYMHACNKTIEQSILENGLISKAGVLSKDREFIDKYIDYEYDYRSYRLYVTSNYNTLYSYGALSPEWLFNNIKDENIMINRDAKLAKQTILSKAMSSNQFKSEDLPQLKNSINNVVNFYFKEKGFNIVIIDKNLADEHGNRVFNRYDEEEEVNLQDFDFDNVLEKANRMMGFKKEKASNVVTHKAEETDSFNNFAKLENSENLNDFGTIIDFLVNKYSTHELTTIKGVLPQDLSLANIPCPTVFIKTEQKERVM